MFFLQIIPRKWPKKIDILGRTFRMGVWQSGEHVAKSSFKTQSFFLTTYRVLFCFVLFCFVLFCFVLFPSSMPWACICKWTVGFHLCICLWSFGKVPASSYFVRTEYWLAEFTSNTLLSCPTAILCSDLDSWCFSIVKKTNCLTGWLH